MNHQADSLGEEIGRQLLSSPRALYLSSILLLGFAIVPGFPWVLFLVIAAALAFAGYKLGMNPNKAGKRGASGSVPSLRRSGGKGDAPSILPHAPAFTCPLGVRLSIDIVTRLSPTKLDDAFEAERIKLQEELGLPFPGITMWQADALPEATYEILIHDVPQTQSLLPTGKVMVPGAEEEKAQRELCEAISNAGGEETSYWINKKETQHKFHTWTVEQVLARHVIEVLRTHASLFIGIQETNWIIEQLNADYPGLAAEIQKILPPQRISEVLRRLLEEQIPIRNIRNIMESLIQWGPKEKDMLLLTEYVRGDLSSFMAYHASQGTHRLSAILFDLETEQHLRQSIRQTPTGNYLSMPPEQVNELIERIAHLAKDYPRKQIAVVTSMDIRRYVRRMIEAQLAWLPVYSYQELSNHIKLETLARVSL
jgi:type III secretion protein V